MPHTPSASPPTVPPVNGPPAATLAALAALRARGRASSGCTLGAFRGHADRLAASPAAPAVLSERRAALPRVRGTAGSYGGAAASRLAAQMEERAVRWAAAADLDLDRRAEIVERFIETLGAAFGPTG
jgi:hypothetical protein